MSYRCDNCNAVRSGSELKRTAVVREVTYNRSFLRFDRRERKKVPYNDASFKGQEIVKEEKLCEDCYEERKELSPNIVNKPKFVEFIGIKRRFSDSEKRSSGKPDLKGLKEKFEGRS